MQVQTTGRLESEDVICFPWMVKRSFYVQVYISSAISRFHTISNEFSEKKNIHICHEVVVKHFEKKHIVVIDEFPSPTTL